MPSPSALVSAPCNISPASEARSLLSAPVSPLQVLEEERLRLLDSLFSATPDPYDLDPTHYALPILISSVQPDTALFLLEAWSRSGLYHFYNLLLLAEPDVLQQADVQALLQAFPAAAAHLGLRSPQHVQPGALLAAIQTYLNTQEPHSYLRLEPHDPWMYSAMNLGLLTLSAHSTAAISLQTPHSQRCGFLVDHDSPQALARELHTILSYDWEALRHIAANGQQWACQRLRPF